MRTLISDGGFQYFKKYDSNNCSVIALTNVLNFPYTVCDNLCTQAGRRRHHGFDMHSIIEYASQALKGIVAFYKVRLDKRPTLKEFCESKRKGRFFVGSRDHCFAVIDGVPMDDSKASSKTKLYVVYGVYYVCR